MKLTPANLFDLLREAWLAFSEDKAPRLAAAIAYQSIFAIAPLLFFILALASGVLASVDVKERLFTFLAQNINEQAAEFIKGLIPDNGLLQRSSIIASVIGLGTLFMGATSLFVQLQDTLNALWGAEPGPTGGVLNMVKSRLRAFALVLVIGVVIIGFLVGNVYLSVIADSLGETIGVGAFFTRVLTLVVGSGLLTLVFAAVYKLLPNVRLKWHEVWVGAAVTAVMFSVAQLAISWYLGRFAPGNAFGAAGALVVLLVWVHFSSMIFFFGAEVTWVYSQKYGSGAGGALSVGKKLALVNKGSTLDSTPSAQEREGLLLAVKQGKPVPGIGHSRPPALDEAKQVTSPAHVPTAPRESAEADRLLPSVPAALWNVISAVLALLSVMVLRVLGIRGRAATPAPRSARS